MNDCFKGLFHFAPADHSRTARESNPSEKKLPNDRVAREPFELSALSCRRSGLLGAEKGSREAG